MDFDCLIVGGGIVGAMSGYYLQQAGQRVGIIDQGAFGGACSHGNCGYISPSHVLPLTTPGAVMKSLKSMLRPDSPFYVKPQLSPTFLKWMWNFSRRCNERDMLQAAASIHRLLASSAQLYEDVIMGESMECEWERIGLLFVYQDHHEFEEYESTNTMTRERFGVDAKPIDAEQLVAMEPALKPGLGGAWFFECDSHLRPDRLMAELKRVLEAKGVTIREHCKATSLRMEQGEARSIMTSEGEMRAKQIIFATGAFTPFMNHTLGCNIPIQPGKGYSLTMPRPRICPKFPIIFEQHRVAITPMQSTYRIGSTMEFAGYDTSINQRRLGLLKRSAEIYLHEPYTDPVLEEWYGWRPMTWDSLPFIDRVPAARNVWIAAGHNMLGISTATATGKLLMELITEQPCHIPATDYALARVGIRSR